MKRIINCFAFTAFFSLSIYAQNAAVMIKEFTAKNVSAGDVSAVTEIFQNAILGTKKFRIIERAGLGDILKEQELQLTGATDTKYAVAIGKIVSVNYLFSGSVSKLGSDCYVSVKLINVETAEIEDAWDANAASISALGPAVKDLAAKAGGLQQVTTVNALSTAAYVEKTIAAREDLTVIDLNDTKATDDDLAAKIRNPGKIRKLRLRNAAITDHFMKEYFIRMNNLDEIDLSNNSKITEDVWLSCFSEMSKIRSLTLAKCITFTDDALIMICKNNRDLWHIVLNQTKISDRALREGLAKLDSLRTVIIPGQKLTDDAVVSVIKHNPNISALSIKANNLTDATIDAIIGSLSTMKYLDLAENNFSSDAIERLKTKFPSCRIYYPRVARLSGREVDDEYLKKNTCIFNNANVINISSASVTDAGIIYLCAMFPNVDSIQLSWLANVTDLSLTEGLALLKKCTSISILEISRITDTGVIALTDSANRIDYLNLKGTSVTQKGINYVRKKFPSCILVY